MFSINLSYFLIVFDDFQYILKFGFKIFKFCNLSGFFAALMGPFQDF